jgi:hypothetical protein
MKTRSILRIVLGAAVTPVPVTFNFAGSVRALVIAALLVCSTIPARAELQLTRVFSNPNPPSGSPKTGDIFISDGDATRACTGSIPGAGTCCRGVSRAPTPAATRRGGQWRGRPR